jgi:photosystem II stability/assembly factor-like uncharacterized protein
VLELVQFADVNTGLAVGTTIACAQEFGPSCPSTVLATSDGGASWVVLYEPLRRIVDMSVTADDAWLLTNDCVTGDLCESRLLRTTERDGTWAETLLPFAIASFSRPTRDDAWIASGADVAVTHDGGESWSELPVPDLAYGVSTQSAIFFLPSGQGWLLVGDGAGAGSQPKELFGTTDGGLTWHSLSGNLDIDDFATPRPPGQLGWVGYVGELYFTSPEDGWMTRGRGGLSRTADGGITWEVLLYDDSGPRIQFADADHGWVIFHNVPQQTRDGETWEPISVPDASP